jgi:hypothetical protein
MALPITGLPRTPATRPARSVARLVQLIRAIRLLAQHPRRARGSMWRARRDAFRAWWRHEAWTIRDHLGQPHLITRCAMVQDGNSP